MNCGKDFNPVDDALVRKLASSDPENNTTVAIVADKPWVARDIAPVIGTASGRKEVLAARTAADTAY